MVQEIDVQVQEACSRDTGVSVSRRGENEREREREEEESESVARGHQPKNPVWACGHVKITKKSTWYYCCMIMIKKCSCFVHHLGILLYIGKAAFCCVALKSPPEFVV